MGVDGEGGGHYPDPYFRKTPCRIPGPKRPSRNVNVIKQSGSGVGYPGHAFRVTPRKASETVEE